jgi:hypothetical protein
MQEKRQAHTVGPNERIQRHAAKSALSIDGAESGIADRRESTAALHQLAAVAHSGQRAVAQRETSGMIEQSPRMQAFRGQIAPLQAKDTIGLEPLRARSSERQAVQRQEDEARPATPGGKSAIRLKATDDSAKERKVKVGDAGMEPWWRAGIGSKKQAVQDTLLEDFEGLDDAGRSSILQRWERGEYSGSWNKAEFAQWVMGSDQLPAQPGKGAVQMVAAANTAYPKTTNFATSHSGNWLQPMEYTTDANANIDFSAPTVVPTNWTDPIEPGSLVDLEGVAGSGQGMTLNATLVTLAGASRDTHYSVANAKHAALGTGMRRHGSGYTWHHLTPNYYMVLMDTKVHTHWSHQGGYSQWT